MPITQALMQNADELNKNPFIWYKRSPHCENRVHIEIRGQVSQWQHSSSYSIIPHVQSFKVYLPLLKWYGECFWSWNWMREKKRKSIKTASSLVFYSRKSSQLLLSLWMEWKIISLLNNINYYNSFKPKYR